MDDDFYLDDDELADENDPGLVGDAKISILDKFSELSQKMKKNVEFNEKDEFNLNLGILGDFLSDLISLSELEESSEADEMAEEELRVKIEEILNHVTVITMKNIDSIIPKNEEESVNTNPSSDDSNLDW